MKTQLLSTLTQQKAWGLLLLTLLHLKGSEAGKAFKNCLKYELNDTTAYDNLLKKLPFPIGTLIPDNYVLNTCCNETSCYEGESVSSCNSFYFPCVKANQTAFCSTWIFGFPYEANKKCSGVVGDNEITNEFSGGACSSKQLNISATVNAISIQSLVGLSQGYAVCGDGNHSSCISTWNSCSWDNNGWSCFISSCQLQFPGPWPGLAVNNPYPSSTSSTSSTSTNIQTTQLPFPTDTQPPTDDHLLEKILIPIGTVTGTGLLSGLIYYLWKKRKMQREDLQSNQRISSNERENEELELRETFSNHDNLSGLNSFQRRSPQDGERGEYINFIEEARNPQEI